ncbi:MAG: hypothetical protein US56_C0040G0004 [Candidatus Moranbacteria bacterium GW2011_GWF2_37_7]|nr:MAG: hypothetical protein US06_C0005G0001 [Parcubacteria group bacterium GW2011_GWC2_36_17]KKQ38577.1 MAG: hypothetical protein US56_C0040G0004 [Candidatus Moranbacteria bacterium GW2011_GWF2_37_7]KKQ59553.1 MAG: hypothetical protein US78_C0002G0016 [Parcubacteria group bacterium GW2011_GWD1_38_16]
MKKIIKMCDRHHQVQNNKSEWMDYSHNLKFKQKMKLKGFKIIRIKCPQCQKE